MAIYDAAATAAATAVSTAQTALTTAQNLQTSTAATAASDATAVTTAVSTMQTAHDAYSASPSDAALKAAYLAAEAAWQTAVKTAATSQAAADAAAAAVPFAQQTLAAAQQWQLKVPVIGAIAEAAEQRMAAAASDEASALAEFKSATIVTPQGVALVKLVNARRRNHDWRVRQAGALAALGVTDIDPAAPVVNLVTEAEISSLLAEAVIDYGEGKAKQTDDALAAHMAAVLAGTAHDPTVVPVDVQ